MDDKVVASSWHTSQTYGSKPVTQGTQGPPPPFEGKRGVSPGGPLYDKPVASAAMGRSQHFYDAATAHCKEMGTC